MIVQENALTPIPNRLWDLNFKKLIKLKKLKIKFEKLNCVALELYRASYPQIEH